MTEAINKDVHALKSMVSSLLSNSHYMAVVGYSYEYHNQ